MLGNLQRFQNSSTSTQDAGISVPVRKRQNRVNRETPVKGSAQHAALTSSAPVSKLLPSPFLSCAISSILFLFFACESWMLKRRKDSVRALRKVVFIIFGDHNLDRQIYHSHFLRTLALLRSDCAQAS